MYVAYTQQHTEDDRISLREMVEWKYGYTLEQAIRGESTCPRAVHSSHIRRDESKEK